MASKHPSFGTDQEKQGIEAAGRSNLVAGGCKFVQLLLDLPPLSVVADRPKLGAGLVDGLVVGDHAPGFVTALACLDLEAAAVL